MAPWLRSVLAVLVGFFTFFFLFSVLTGVTIKLFHLDIDRPTVPYMTVNLLSGYLPALAGGYLAGLISGRRAVLHGVLVAAIMLGFAVLNLSKGLGGGHTPYVVLLNLGAPLMCVLGAWIEAKRVQRFPPRNANIRA